MYRPTTVIQWELLLWRCDRVFDVSCAEMPRYFETHGYFMIIGYVCVLCNNSHRSEKTIFMCSIGIRSGLVISSKGTR